jgi:hypothetical protein
MASIKPPVHLGELFDFLEDVIAWVKDRDGRYFWVLNHLKAAPLAFI